MEPFFDSLDTAEFNLTPKQARTVSKRWTNRFAGCGPTLGRLCKCKAVDLLPLRFRLTIRQTLRVAQTHQLG